MRNRTVPIIVSILICASVTASPTKAELTFCNRTPVDLTAALGYLSSGAWASAGWYSLRSGECKEVVSGDLENRYYYGYAEDSGTRRWGGSYNFCTRPQAFQNIQNTNCEAQGFLTTGFFQIDTGDADSYTQDLTCDDCQGQTFSASPSGAGASNPTGTLLENDLGGYDDSWQTKTETETCDCDSPFGTFECPCISTECRSLRHSIVFRVTGPQESQIQERANSCFNQAMQAGAFAGIVAVATGGAAAGAAAETAKDYFLACMGDYARQSVEVRFDDESHWTDWGNCL
ncbi:MAG TPA: DUF1036 domain-containing protein [Thermoanaerobaculia bacterium]|nr:DUF1036 domain-containing protein [Thermoanaerobaculia bacterium]